MKTAPFRDYGILERTINENDRDRAVEELVRNGYTVLSEVFLKETIECLADAFEDTLSKYRAYFGEDNLKKRDEYNTIRLPLCYHPAFLDLAINTQLLHIISKLICGKYILNQQNGIINPPCSRYNQDSWHRDLPYQHFVSDRPIIINALYCVDSFSLENGATYVLPGSHKFSSFPSNEYVLKHSVQIVAPAGSFIILDGMLYHRGGKNSTIKSRRAVNHVYTIPHIKQQIAIPSALGNASLDHAVKCLLGYQYEIPETVDDFIIGRPLLQEAVGKSKMNKNMA